eukprot:359595-Chlamydomonas_euryale.AAC.4
MLRSRMGAESFIPFTTHTHPRLQMPRSGMGVDSFSTARLWAPYAKASLREAEGGGGNGPLAAAWCVQHRCMLSPCGGVAAIVGFRELFCAEGWPLLLLCVVAVCVRGDALCSD